MFTIIFYRSYETLERPIRFIEYDDNEKMYSLLAGGTDLSLEVNPRMKKGPFYTFYLTLLEHFFNTWEDGNSWDDDMLECLLTFMHTAGYSFWEDMEMHSSSDVGDIMKRLEKEPFTLQNICRLRIRKQLGGIKFQEKLQQLNLPTVMKEFLTFRKEGLPTT